MLELLDPYRSTRGVKVRGRKVLEDVMVRRLKEDIRTVQGGFPKRCVVRVVIDGLPEASAHGRMERLLRQTGVHSGLLFNGRVLRLFLAARRRVKWPGMAAVVVSVIHVLKGAFAGRRCLDGRAVEQINAVLFHRGGHDDPARLAANDGKSFVGSYVLDMGFTFDDTDKKGVATPIAEMRRLIEKDPPTQDTGPFSVLQSRPQELWARFFGSTMKDDAVNIPSDCFETFPFPEEWTTDPALEAVGKTYYEFRAQLMVKNNEGLTKTYNRFHDPDERDPEILKLRELHAAMDRAVLDVYGWSDIPTDCEFLLDYEIDEEEWGNRKKPWGYRWPDDVCDELLARLLELNTHRAADETRSGLAAKKHGRKPRIHRPKTQQNRDLFS